MRKAIGGHRTDLWRTEAAMFAAFQTDAEREGWLCYPETCGHDLLLEAGPTLDPNRWRGVELGDIVVVEGKLRPTFEVLEQAAPPWTRHPYLIVSRRTAADWYAVLVPGAGEAFRLAARAMRILVFTRAPDAPSR